MPRLQIFSRAPALCRSAAPGAASDSDAEQLAYSSGGDYAEEPCSAELPANMTFGMMTSGSGFPHLEDCCIMSAKSQQWQAGAAAMHHGPALLYLPDRQQQVPSQWRSGP